jgi:hypothetical protein
MSASLTIFEKEHAAREKYIYFICGLAGVLFAYVGKDYFPVHPLIHRWPKAWPQKLAALTEDVFGSTGLRPQNRWGLCQFQFRSGTSVWQTNRLHGLGQTRLGGRRQRQGTGVWRCMRREASEIAVLVPWSEKTADFIRFRV